MKEFAKDKRYCSLDVTKELGITAHANWVSKNIVKNKESIEEVTGETVLIEVIPNKRGKPTTVAYITEPQLVYLVSNSANSKKTQTKKMKDKLAKMFKDLAQKAGELDERTNQWSNRKANLVTNSSVWADMPYPRFKDGELDNHFSPDVVFAEFLETLEGEAGYSLKWDFEFSQSEFVPLPVTKEQAKILKAYDKFAYVSDEGENDIWHPTRPLPEAPNWILDTKVKELGVVWINQHPLLPEYWNTWIERAAKIVEVYNSDELRIERGLPTIEEQKSGDWEAPDKPCIELIQFLNWHEHRFLDIYENYDEKKAYGFQVHKDWLNWLNSTDEVVEALRRFHLKGNEKASKIIQYDPWEAYENGLEYWLDWNNDTRIPNLNCPLFQRIKLYDNNYKPLFNWYLENIWLRQHSVKFFQSIDPQGFPKLCEAMKALPSTTRLPRTFLEAMKPQLAGAKV